MMTNMMTSHFTVVTFQSWNWCWHTTERIECTCRITIYKIKNKTEDKKKEVMERGVHLASWGGYLILQVGGGKGRQDIRDEKKRDLI